MVTEFRYPLFFRYAPHFLMVLSATLLYAILKRWGGIPTNASGIVVILFFLGLSLTALWDIFRKRKCISRLEIDKSKNITGYRDKGGSISFSLEKVVIVREEKPGVHCGGKSCSQHTIYIESSNKEVIAVAPYLGGLNALIREIKKANPSVEIKIDKEYYADENFDY